MSYPYAGGSNKPATKIWHPMWGLWLVVSSTKAQQHQQQPIGWPVAKQKVIWKSSSFNKKNTENVPLSSSGWQADFCSARFHHKTQPAVHCWDHMCEGSAHTTSRDARCGNVDQNWFLKKSDIPDSEGMIVFLPRCHSTYRQEVKLTMPEKDMTLHSEQFVVPGAHDIDRVLGAPNFVRVL